MGKIFKTELSEAELRRLIREEVKAALNNEPGNDSEGFLDVSQASEYIKLKSGTIYNLVNSGKIPFHKSGKRVLFKKSELAEWIKRDEKQPGGPNN